MTGPTAVDWTVVASWITARGVADGPITDIVPIGGGTQNLMFGFRCGDKCFVLRRGPKHLRRNTNNALRREARVLGALATSDVPIPRLIANEDDDSVLGSVFYLMEPVEGFNPAVGLPQPHAGDPKMQREMGLHAVGALGALGAVEPDRVGLGDFGKPDGFLERQVPQWLRMLEGYAALEGYPGHDLPNIDELAGWLTAHRPAGFQPGIMHGDFHLANLMYRYDGPQVAAIVDWEMCTLGDPLLDLGWLLATWSQDGPTAQMTSVPGLPTRAELLDHYAAVAQRPVDHAVWYAAMACFKLAIVLEGTNARAQAGKAPPQTGDLLHAVAIELLSKATVFIDKGV